MPVKVIKDENAHVFERKLEEFCKNKKVIDIKFSAHYSTLFSYDAHYYALVIYDDRE